jgi:hypothetical protein
VVDNEALSIGFLDFDLARSWYRWELGPEAWRRFLDRYAAHRSELPGEQPFRFWRIAATALGARVRVVNRVAGADRARQKLAALSRSAA